MPPTSLDPLPQIIPAEPSPFPNHACRHTKWSGYAYDYVPLSQALARSARRLFSIPAGTCSSDLSIYDHQMKQLVGIYMFTT
jgi:hypothetical protein